MQKRNQVQSGFKREAKEGSRSRFEPGSSGGFKLGSGHPAKNRKVGSKVGSQVGFERGSKWVQTKFRIPFPLAQSIAAKLSRFFLNNNANWSAQKLPADQTR